MGVFARHIRWLWIAAVATTAAAGLLAVGALTTDTSAQAGGRSLSQLNSALGANQATQSNLAADVRSLNGQISSLENQISVVRSREADVRRQLAADRVDLAATHKTLRVEKHRLARLRVALKHAQTILSAQLVSSYENPQANPVAVVLSSNGFSQMLDQLQYLRTAEHSQQTIIAFTTRAKAAATASARRLASLQSQQTAITRGAATQADALAGMNGLLSGREASLSHIEAARTTALANARAEGGTLRSAIASIKAQQAAAAAAAAKAAAAAAAAAASAASSTGASSYSGPTPSGGWAIPAAVVMCESGGQNLPPNSAGASGYYQILPSTWTGEGGSGPAAYLAPKSEQDAIAAKLWDGGAGARNWVCAGLVGIT